MAKRAVKKPDSIHWLAPTAIVTALIAGCLFAIGHHLFYRTLDGQIAPTRSYDILGSDVSDQQMNIAIGTAFAFLVKAFLVMALSTAYIQLFWRAMLFSSSKVTLGSLDTMFSGLTHVFSLLRVWIWWHYPLLFSLVILAWLIPIASIITPATLTIEAASVQPTPSTTMQVPRPGFFSLNFVNDMSSPGDLQTTNPEMWYTYTGPSFEVRQIADAVVATGPILTIKAPFVNATYSTRFNGPIVKCQNVSDSHRKAIEQNIVAAGKLQDLHSCTAYAYLAWTSKLPFVRTRNDSYVLQSANFQKGDTMIAKLHLAVLPGMFDVTYEYPGVSLNACFNSTTLFRDATLLECSLYNSTLDSRFYFDNGEQRIITTAHHVDDQPVTTVNSVTTTSYPTPCLTISEWGNCDFDPNTLARLSYQAILEAFNAAVGGSVYAGPEMDAAVANTSIVNTILSRTPELQFLKTPLKAKASSSTSLQSTLAQKTEPGFKGLVNSDSSLVLSPLSRTIEEVFMNVTLSMMSSTLLRPNMSSAYAPEPVNVTHPIVHNVYKYYPMKLWIAYGLAILLSTFASAIGLSALLASGASYSDNFSSIFRVARGTLMVTEVKEVDVDGKDPLPTYLSKVVVRLGSHEKDQDEESRGSSSQPEPKRAAAQKVVPLKRRQTL